MRYLLLEGGIPPTRAHEGDAGFDLYKPAYSGDVDLQPGQRMLFPLAVCFEIEAGWYGDIRDRSSMAKAGIAVHGGIIDSGYRGEVSVLLHNFSDQPVRIFAGQRIAQMIIKPCYTGTLTPANELTDTVRGDAGFGSTGK